MKLEIEFETEIEIEFETEVEKEKRGKRLKQLSMINKKRVKEETETNKCKTEKFEKY